MLYCPPHSDFVLGVAAVNLSLPLLLLLLLFFFLHSFRSFVLLCSARGRSAGGGGGRAEPGDGDGGRRPLRALLALQEQTAAGHAEHRDAARLHQTSPRQVRLHRISYLVFFRANGVSVERCLTYPPGHHAPCTTY